VTGIPGVKIGDSVVLIGQDGSECITVEEMAALADTFNYEFVCGIARRVPRVYFNGEKYLFCVNYLNK